MKLVPSHLCDLVFGPGWTDAPALAELVASAVKLGAGRVEVDLDQAPSELADLVLGYQEANRMVASQLEGGEAIGPWIITSRLLVSRVQQAGTKSAQRGDLAAELAGLREIDECDKVAEILLASTVDLEALKATGAELVESTGAKTVVKVRIEGQRDWPESLGGGASRNEIERHILLSANHASWRDRQLRRLTRVDVHALEILAEVEPFAVRIGSLAQL